jgi:hypothetical protein
VDRLPVGWDEGPGLVASVWRFRWLVAAVALAGALAGVGFSTVQPVMYEASSQILLARPSAGQSDAQSVQPDRYVRNQAAFIMSPPVLERAVRQVKGRVTVKQLRIRLVAEASKESDLVTVRVQDPTAQGAVELANAVGQAYAETARDQAKDAVDRTVGQLRATERALSRELAGLQAKSRNDVAAQVRRDAVRQQLAQVLARANELRLDDARGNPVASREGAELPESPAQPKPLRLGAVGGLLGLVVAAGLAWGLAWRRQAPAIGLQPPAPTEATALPAVRRPTSSTKPRPGGGLPGRNSRPAEVVPDTAVVPDERSARARARLIKVLGSVAPEDADQPDATVTIDEPEEHENGHPTANGSGKLVGGLGLQARPGTGPSTTPGSAASESNGDSAAHG